jgi:transposase
MPAQSLPQLVGIDLSKDRFTAALQHDGAEVVRVFELTHDGLRAFQAFLDGYDAFPEGFAFGLEASGPYTDLLLGWLLARQARVFLLNPLQIHRFRKAQSLRRTKTDALDACTILRYMAQTPRSLEPVRATDDLLALASEYEQITQQVARLKTQIRQQLHALFPELASYAGLFSRRLLHLLLAFPSAQALQHAQPQRLLQVWLSSQRATGRPAAYTPHSLQQLARDSIGLRSQEREVVLQSKIRQLLHLLEEQTSLRQALLQAVRHAHPEAWGLLTAIPGLGPITVALFLAQARSLDRFPSHRQLVAFVGIDPTTYESGQYRAPSHISKRGNPQLRKTLYLMAQSVIRYTNTFAAHFEQLVARGKAYRVAVIACANKLLRVIYALLKRRAPFQDRPCPALSHS